MDDKVFEGFLEESCRRGHALADESSVVNILAERGSPPHGYLVGFEGVEHLVRDSNGVVRKTMDPILVEVRFPPDFLRTSDRHLGLKVVGIVSHLFHPNVKRPAFCLGHIRPGTPLDEILRMVYEVISFQNVTPDERDAFSPEACRYVREHPEVLKSLRIPPLKRRRLNVRATVEHLSDGEG